MKIAVVGCGQIADAHIQEAKKIPGVSVVAVCDLSIHMAEQAAVRYKIPGIYTSLKKMLKETRPDVVHITTPPASHLSIGKIAVEHGSHAYIEKPFTVDAAEADELIDAATRAGKLICVGHNLAFDSAFLRLKDQYRQGILGDIVHVSADMGYNLSGAFGSVFMGDPTHWLHKLPGGLAHNNISHPLSLILEFFADEKPDIHARGLRWRNNKFGDVRDRFFDEVRVMISGTNTTAFMSFSCTSRPVQLCTVVYGTRNQAVASLDSRTMRLVEGATMPGPLYKIQWAYRDLKQAGREYVRHIGNLIHSRLHYFEGMNELFRRFYMALNGKGEMPVPMSEARRMAVILDEIFQQCNKNDLKYVGKEAHE